MQLLESQKHWVYADGTDVLESGATLLSTPAQSN